MELKQLESFVSVVRHQSFTKAAEQLFISQPTISTHIRMLEEELHSRLIIRTTKSIEITPRGMELYDCARSMLELKNNLMKRWFNENNKTIRLGASTIPSAYILPEILPRFRREHPDICFSVQQSDSQGIVSGLMSSSFDLGLIGMKTDQSALACLPFYRDRMVFITPVNDHFLALKKQTDLNALRLLQEPVILREPGSGSRKSMDSYLESLHVRETDLNITARINDQEAIKSLVASGLGISMISERAARNFAESNRLLIFDFPENTLTRDLYLVYRREYILSEHTRDFMHFVLSSYGFDGV